MGKKKIKHKMKMETEPIDPNLDEVDEDRKLEIDYDEETNETLIICHYRRRWGDGFDADIDHALNPAETNQVILLLMSILEQQKACVLDKIAKSTLELKETNPMQGPKDVGDISNVQINDGE